MCVIPPQFDTTTVGEPTLRFFSNSVSHPSHIFNMLEAEPYSCQYRTDVNHARDARCVMRLRKIPEDVATFVHQRVPTIDPFDWWWVRRQDKTGPWIEVSIRSKAVIKLEADFHVNWLLL
jgi:hypothetical protein